MPEEELEEPPRAQLLGHRCDPVPVDRQPAAGHVPVAHVRQRRDAPVPGLERLIDVVDLLHDRSPVHLGVGERPDPKGVEPIGSVERERLERGGVHARVARREADDLGLIRFDGGAYSRQKPPCEPGDSSVKCLECRCNP